MKQTLLRTTIKRTVGKQDDEKQRGDPGCMAENSDIYFMIIGLGNRNPVKITTKKQVKSGPRKGSDITQLHGPQRLVITITNMKKSIV